MSAPRWRRYLRLTKPDIKGDVEDELSFHMEMRVQDYIRRGMSADEARREALARFGGIDDVRESLIEWCRCRLCG